MLYCMLYNLPHHFGTCLNRRPCQQFYRVVDHLRRPTPPLQLPLNHALRRTQRFFLLVVRTPSRLYTAVLALFIYLFFSFFHFSRGQAYSYFSPLMMITIRNAHVHARKRASEGSFDVSNSSVSLRVVSSCLSEA